MDLNRIPMSYGYFDTYSYHTPEKKYLTLKEKILLNNRLYFTLKYGGTCTPDKERSYKKSLRHKSMERFFI